MRCRQVAKYPQKALARVNSLIVGFGDLDHGRLDLGRGAILQDRLAAADLLQGELTSFVVHFLEVVELSRL